MMSYMKPDRRLSGVLHVLLHLAASDAPMTSATLARVMGTNPVVVRRILAGLRTRGHVRSEKGHGGGWSLARALRRISLRDVYEAIGAPPLLALGHRHERPGCLVEQAVNRALGASLAEAEARLLARLGRVSLATLAADIRPHLAAHQRAHLATEHP